MANRIELQISENTKLVAEINPDKDYKEIFVGVEKDGCWIQDLVRIGKPYEYDSNLNVIMKDGYRIMVFGDGYSDDCTHDHIVDEYKEEY